MTGNTTRKPILTRSAARDVPPYIYVLGVIFILSFLMSLYLFVLSYSSAEASIQEERADYVSEISSQIITSLDFMREEFSGDAAVCADMIDNGGFHTLEELRTCLGKRAYGEIVLISTQGRLIDLNGKEMFITDRKLMLAPQESGGVLQMFTSLNGENDYWVFTSPILPVELDIGSFDAIALAVPSNEFRDSLAISLFDGAGASYIINKDGSIAIKPSTEGVVFLGYNLFASMLQAGARPEDIDAVSAALEAGQSGDELIKISGIEWLVSYNPFSIQNAVVVAIPLTITAAQTYAGLSNTILFAMLVVLFLALIFALFFAANFMRNKERRRIVAAAQAKSAFFSKMSHDIRTPLNAVIGLQTLARESDDLASVKGYIEQSSVATGYLLSIINDVLDMSRIDSGKMSIANEPFDMCDLISEINAIISGMAAERCISYECRAEDEYKCSYVGDSVRIKQVLANLLNNSVKFTNPGGRIVFAVSRAPAGDGCDTFAFVVSDTGIGMSEQFLTQIYTPFEQEQPSLTTQYAGSGLGLSIVYNLVTLMGGTIDVKSRVGEGTEFTVTLTLTRSEAAVPHADVQAGSFSSYAGSHVLLAEDNNVNQFVVVSLLEKMFQIQADVADDGMQAVERFEQSSEGYYDLIFMDVNMPNMDGLEATRTIRALPRADAGTVPIVALSANAYSEDAALSLEAGMNGHLAKPLEMEALSGALKKFIKEQEGKS